MAAISPQGKAGCQDDAPFSVSHKPHHGVFRPAPSAMRIATLRFPLLLSCGRRDGVDPETGSSTPPHQQSSPALCSGRLCRPIRDCLHGRDERDGRWRAELISPATLRGSARARRCLPPASDEKEQNGNRESRGCKRRAGWCRHTSGARPRTTPNDGLPGPRRPRAPAVTSI